MTGEGVGTGSPETAARGRNWLPFTIDKRWLPPLLVTGILVAGQLTMGNLESLPQTVLAIATAVIVERLLGRLLRGFWPHLYSAYISGISVGILIRSPYLWPFALCSALSITSKHVIRVKDRHLWNPSNFGITAMLMLAPTTVAPLSIQWGNAGTIMAVIWAWGAVVMAKFRKLHITAVYVASFFAFAAIRAAMTDQAFQTEVAPITGPMYQLFALFMITDPATTIRGRNAQMAYAVLIAFGEHLFRLAGSYALMADRLPIERIATYAPFLSLFLIGPTLMLIQIWRDSRREAALAVS